MRGAREFQKDQLTSFLLPISLKYAHEERLISLAHFELSYVDTVNYSQNDN